MILVNGSHCHFLSSGVLIRSEVNHHRKGDPPSSYKAKPHHSRQSLLEVLVVQDPLLEGRSSPLSPEGTYGPESVLLFLESKVTSEDRLRTWSYFCA